jgi:hypothetical protein
MYIESPLHTIKLHNIKLFIHTNTIVLGSSSNYAGYYNLKEEIYKHESTQPILWRLCYGDVEGIWELSISKLGM